MSTKSLPKGAGGVRCLDCGESASADGKGSPIALLHKDGCLTKRNADATARMHAMPCPGCGCEPEVTHYLRDEVTKVRRGYVCTCRATVVDGMLTGHQ